MQKGHFSKEFLQKIAATEPQWMREKRLEAYALYESLPMPHTTEDDVWRRTVDMRTQDYWRRTRRYLRGLDVEKHHPSLPTNGAPSAKDVGAGLPSPYTEEASGVLVQVDGQRQHISNSEELKKRGLLRGSPHRTAGTTGTAPRLLHEQGSDLGDDVKERKYCPT